MSFDLVVLAVDPGATDATVRITAERCRSLEHPEGELDGRIVAFYEDLRARFPDFPPYDGDSPWTSTPLDVGIDHVSVNLSFGERGRPALQLIDDLAQRYGLTIYDPQGEEVIRPTDARAPMDPTLAELVDEPRTDAPRTTDGH